MERTCLIVPSIREESLRRFIREWRPTGLFERTDFVLVEDNPEPTFPLADIFEEEAFLSRGGDEGETRPPWNFRKEGIHHFSWRDIEGQLGNRSWIVPRRSDTVRSFGYWWAWKQGYDLLCTLDDDCYPEKGYERWDEIHRSLLTRTKWFNTLNNVRPRGTPYKNLGRRPVYVNHGLWTNVLDYDAPQQLVDPIPEEFSNDNRIVPHGSYFSLCGMNVMWRREATVLMYHMLMGHAFQDGKLIKLPCDRFGDIHCGIVMKKICDHLGWAVSSGIPYIHHDRASDPFVNLRKEANWIQVNEWFWEKIDRIPLKGFETPEDCYAEIGRVISTWDGEWQDYWQMLGWAMQLWTDLFRQS